jgi:fructan beta-fructosidase
MSQAAAEVNHHVRVVRHSLSPLPPLNDRSSWSTFVGGEGQGEGNVIAIAAAPPFLSDEYKRPTLWVLEYVKNQKPGPMAQTMSMAGPLARNRMRSTRERCFTELSTWGQRIVGGAKRLASFETDHVIRLPISNALCVDEIELDANMCWLMILYNESILDGSCVSSPCRHRPVLHPSELTMQITKCCAVLCAWIAVSSATLAADDIVIANFESETYGSWKVTGDAFGPGPAKGTLPGQMHVDGFNGERLVNSFFNGDGTTGSLESPPILVKRKYIKFLIGGGQNEQQLAIQLLIDGKVVRSSTGSNSQAGGTEALAPESWDVSEFAGKTAIIRIIDEAKGGWGHINVDDILQTYTKPIGLLSNAERKLTASHRYLHLPIKNGVPNRVVTLFVDGQKIVRNDIELADDQADWFAPMDVSQWKGRELTLVVDKLREDSKALSSIEQSDTIRDSESLYHETLRGQFHFSPRRGWNNDPNGMVYFNGEYHLFFQHNPYGWGWGNMHWGHAVSKDMVHWQELGDKLLPDDMGPMFSGSAVVDWNNTSGFGSKEKPPLVLIYTAAGSPTVQGIAYSTDGRNFTKYSGNPILKEITGGNRDPKVMWHEPSKQWVMVLYVEFQKKHTVHFFTSPDLKEWKLASISEGDGPGQRFLFECPDFFELPVDGNMSNRKWVLTAADSQYAIGTFDGTTFKAEQERIPGHRGRGFYAAQTEVCVAA